MFWSPSSNTSYVAHRWAALIGERCMIKDNWVTQFLPVCTQIGPCPIDYLPSTKFLKTFLASAHSFQNSRLEYLFIYYYFYKGTQHFWWKHKTALKSAFPFLRAPFEDFVCWNINIQERGNKKEEKDKIFFLRAFIVSWTTQRNFYSFQQKWEKAVYNKTSILFTFCLFMQQFLTPDRMHLPSSGLKIFAFFIHQPLNCPLPPFPVVFTEKAFSPFASSWET